MAHPDQELIARALRREPAACRRLVDLLTLAIQSRVNAALLRRGRASRSELLDLTQEVFSALLDDDGRILRSWDPERGATLLGFVALIAERRVASILVSGRKSAGREDPRDPADLEDTDPAPTPELSAISKDQLARVLDALR